MVMVVQKIEELKKNNVKFIRPVFVDILDRMLDFTILIHEIDSLIKDGKGFDGSSVEGFASTEESDLRFMLRFMPEIETLTIFLLGISRL